MQRLTSYEYSAAISWAFDLLPVRVADMLKCVHFFTGTNPVYAGLHKYNKHIDIAHACYPYHTVDKSLTVVLPILKFATPFTVIHELGHMLDYLLNFRHDCLPVDDFAQTNRREAFAESFRIQHYWLGNKAEDIFQSDKATQYLFENLKAGRL